MGIEIGLYGGRGYFCGGGGQTNEVGRGGDKDRTWEVLSAVKPNG